MTVDDFETPDGKRCFLAICELREAVQSLRELIDPLNNRISWGTKELIGNNPIQPEASIHTQRGTHK